MGLLDVGDVGWVVFCGGGGAGRKGLAGGGGATWPMAERAGIRAGGGRLMVGQGAGGFGFRLGRREVGGGGVHAWGGAVWP